MWQVQWWKCLAGLALLAGAASAAAPPPRPFNFVQYPVTSHTCFCVSPDGKRLALDAWDVWDIPTARRVLHGETRGAWAMAFSPDGRWLAVGGNYSELYVYDARTAAVYWNLTLVGHGEYGVLWHVEFTPDSKFLVSMSSNGTLRVWDVRKKAAQALFCFPSTLHMNNGWRDYLRAWRTIAGDKPPDGVKAFVVFKKPIKCLEQFAISPDGKTIAVAAGTPAVMLLELATGKVLKTFGTRQKAVYSVRFSADGRLLALGGGDSEPDLGRCTIEVWDARASRRLSTLKGHRQTVLKLAFSPDGKSLASAGLQDGVRVWDVGSGKHKFALHQEKEVRGVGVAFLPDGKTLLTLVGDPGPVCFWDAATGKFLK